MTEPMMPRDPQVQTITAALAAPFEPRDIKFKPQMVKNNRCLAMAYIDARLIQDRLDEVLGVENWEDAYKILPDGSVMCRLRLKLGDRWITKTDVGSLSEQPDSGDRLKAAFSDALKRAAVKFGIGRYLYRLPAQWVDYDPVKKQIAQVPQLPAFALPNGKAKPAQSGFVSTESKKEEKGEPVKPATVKAEAPKAEAPKAEPLPTPPATKGEKEVRTGATETKVVAVAPKSPVLPANGQELHRRLQDYDAKLASQKLCQRGALLAHVTQAGVKAGYTANMSDWAGPAIPFAVNAVKQFEQSIRGGNTEPRTAA